MITCEDCGSKITYKSNELYCIKCGLVYDDEPVDFGPERSLDQDGQQIASRTGQPITWLHPFSGTIIGYINETNKGIKN